MCWGGLTEVAFAEYGLQRDNHFILKVLGFKVLGSGSHLSALDFDGGVMATSELFEQVFTCAFGGCLIATSKDVDGGITEFGPCVDGQVAFSDHNDTTHSLGEEGVECRFDDGCLSFKGSIDHDLLNKLDIVNDFCIAVVTLKDDLTA